MSIKPANKQTKFNNKKTNEKKNNANSGNNGTRVYLARVLTQIGKTKVGQYSFASATAAV